MASSPLPKIPNCICHVKYQRHWRMPFLTWVALTKIGIKHFLSHCYLFIRPLSGHPSIRHQRDRLNSQMQLRTTFTTTWFALSRDLELFFSFSSSSDCQAIIYLGKRDEIGGLSLNYTDVMSTHSGFLLNQQASLWPTRKTAKSRSIIPFAS